MKVSLTVILYVLSIVGSGCGFLTQMLVSGYWSTAYSNDVLMFSLNVAFYLLSLGLGALLSQKWRRPDLGLLFEITLALCLWTGVSIAFLRWGISSLGNFVLLPVLAVVVAGVLAGNIIPLTLKVGRSEPTLNLSTLFFLDYTAAILFTLLFTFVLLIPLGYGKTAILLSICCLLVTIALMMLSKTYTSVCVFFAVAVVAIPYPAYRSVMRKVAPTMDSRGEAKVLLSRQSHYQKIVLTEEKSTSMLAPNVRQHVLYLDGFVQFSSSDEQRYHMCITNIPVAAAEFAGHPVRKALILGGGDGLAARNLAYISTVKKITMVELDPTMIELSRREPVFRLYNLDSLRHSKVKVIVDDAFRWVKTAQEKFDLIVIDFPAPKNLTLSRLFTAEFYRSVFRLLSPTGFVAIQAGPTFQFGQRATGELSDVNACVKRTLAAIGYRSHVYASTQDEDSFVLVTPNPKFDMLAFAKRVGIVGLNGMGLICNYDPTWKEPIVKVNTLNTLVLSDYMLKWFKTAGGPFFNYRGSHSVFLPD